jgi:hypothetical protein
MKRLIIKTAWRKEQGARRKAEGSKLKAQKEQKDLGSGLQNCNLDSSWTRSLFLLSGTGPGKTGGQIFILYPGSKRRHCVVGMSPNRGVIQKLRSLPVGLHN